MVSRWKKEFIDNSAAAFSAPRTDDAALEKQKDRFLRKIGDLEMQPDFAKRVSGDEGRMDGRGRAKDNIWIERFWKTINYEYIYIQPEENGAVLFAGIKRFIEDYNYHRRHQGINRTVPSKRYLRSVAWT